MNLKQSNVGLDASAPLRGQVSQIEAQVRREPAAPAHRAALFQLHCALGAWDKAARQLAVLGSSTPRPSCSAPSTGRCSPPRRSGSRCSPGGRPRPAWAIRLPGSRSSPRPCGWMVRRSMRRQGVREQALAQADASGGRLDGTPSPGSPMPTSGWGRCSRPSSTGATCGSRSTGCDALRARGRRT